MSKSKTKTQLELELQAARAEIVELKGQLQQAEDSPDSLSTQKLLQLLEILPVGISILDVDNNVVFENRTLQKMVGLDDEQLRTGMYWQRKYLAADGTPMPVDGFASRQAQRIGTSVSDVETGIVKESGETIWLNVSAVPVDFSDWKTVVVSADITERKRAEEISKQSEQKYSALFEKSAVPAALTKMPEGVFADVNEAFQTAYGYTREEVIGKTSIEIGMARPEERNRTYANLQKLGALRENEKHLFTKSGEARIGGINVNRIIINGQEYVITTIHDVTERKQAEAELLRSQDNFFRAFESNPAALAITRRVDGKFIRINQAYTAIMGYSPAELIGHNVNDFSIYVNPQEREQLLQTMAKQGAVHNYELTVRDQSQAQHQILVSMEPLLYDLEDCIISAFIDITERKLMEEELRRSNAELEQFAYVASHDLQEPLRAVAGMVHLLGQRYKGQLDARADEYIGHAIEAASRMQALINDLLAYSRVERRNNPIEPVSAEDCLQDALKNLSVLVHETRAVITAEPLPIVYADATQLIQLFQNLIGNGIKFRGEHDPQVSISVMKLEGAWQFSVHDNGIGIEAEYFERIFLVFQRLHTRREYAGTGIGLAICKKIVERHSGQIWVESTPGNGSTFHFTLPIRNANHYDTQPRTHTH